ncbi:hypothetical protein [Hymenobacter weizhouensis]|uniref:hypothetical protein n=1 Tax=Hymenobacter sp. YIM 151500-1 TaxID=2987689 RepID=UPI00222691F2|nr:hypothetical protein [Hymenobacter sp. YIM 151500-1]UYZ65161.1 hypothetical protein OIS53_09995 [Hymenobacter sp. YIM 151500-1]
MLSTAAYTALPDKAALQQLCKALATLDAVIYPDLEYRYYSYDAHWAPGEEFFEMNDGEGDQLLALFRAEGCVLNGYADGLPEPDKEQLTRRLPEVFREFMFGEPVSSIGTTFCFWQTQPGQWQLGDSNQPEDGSEDLLGIFDNNPQTYIDWAEEYYGEEDIFHVGGLPFAVVQQIYHGTPLTRPMVHALVNTTPDWYQLEADLQAIGYPYDFS